MQAKGGRLKIEKELLTYLENPDTIPNEIYRNIMWGQRLLAKIEHDLKQSLQEMKQTYNYILNLAKNTCDGKAFEAEMSALLIKYIEELMVQKEQEDMMMCILEQRRHCNSSQISYSESTFVFWITSAGTVRQLDWKFRLLKFLVQLRNR